MFKSKVHRATATQPNGAEYRKYLAVGILALALAVILPALPVLAEGNGPATPATGAGRQADATIPNGSLEEAADADTPVGWYPGNWGTNKASFLYENDGHSDAKSVKVTIADYVDGDGKWVFEPISSLRPGEQYRFTVWYRANVEPMAKIMYLRADKSENYISMPRPRPGTDGGWQRYSEAFSVPLDAVAVSAFLMIDQNGWLQTDDYSIDGYRPDGFQRPLLTLTFDDRADNTSTALPVLNSHGFKSTLCLTTQFVEGIPEAVNNVLAFQRSGHEICAHTVTHPPLTSLNGGDLNYELQHPQQYLQSITGTTVENFASPYGDYNMAVNNAIRQYYQSHRTVDEGFNSKDNFDRYGLRVQNVLDTTSIEQFRHWTEQARADGTWLILVYHRVTDDAGPVDTLPAVFAEQMEIVARSGITVRTLRDALREVTCQL